jgi:hypothetical protein
MLARKHKQALPIHETVAHLQCLIIRSHVEREPLLPFDIQRQNVDVSELRLSAHYENVVIRADERRVRQIRRGLGSNTGKWRKTTIAWIEYNPRVVTLLRISSRDSRLAQMQSKQEEARSAGPFVGVTLSFRLLYVDFLMNPRAIQGPPFQTLAANSETLLRHSSN